MNNQSVEIIEASLYPTRQEDIDKGWVRISEDIRKGIENRSYIKLSSNGKEIFCQVRGTPGKSGIIEINMYYREKLDLNDTQCTVKFSIEKAAFWGKIEALSSHPDSIVRIAFGLGSISVGLGCLSVVIAVFPIILRHPIYEAISSIPLIKCIPAMVIRVIVSVLTILLFAISAIAIKIGMRSIIRKY